MGIRTGLVAFLLLWRCAGGAVINADFDAGCPDGHQLSQFLLQDADNFNADCDFLEPPDCTQVKHWSFPASLGGR